MGVLAPVDLTTASQFTVAASTLMDEYQNMGLSDDDFIKQFENQTLPSEYFDHHGHLRLAWLYLRDCTLDEAVARVTEGIRLYAASLGATDKFQHTLTEAIVRIMAQRMGQGSAATLDDYLAANPDLVNDIFGVVGRYYSPELLESSRARSGFVAPDLASLDSMNTPAV